MTWSLCLNTPTSEKTKVILSYKFTGIPLEELHKDLGILRSVLEDIWLEVFCSLFEEEYFVENGFSIDQIYDYCLQIQRSCKIMIAFIKHSQKSSGMLKELELAKSLGQKIIVLIRSWLEVDYQEFIESSALTIRFHTVDDLAVLLRSFDIKKITN